MSDGTEILIVEDSPTQAEQLRYILEQKGYRVESAVEGKQALAFLNSHKPALVISDIVMPEMNGYELCRRIKGDKNLRDIPVILMTSLTGPEEVLEGLICKADSFITKPYSEGYFFAQVERVLADKSLSTGEQKGIEVEISLPNQNRLITADPRQMLSLLFSTYEAALQRNTELVQTQDKLRLLNDNLEDLVGERTAALSAEVVVRKQAEEETRLRLRELEVLYNGSLAFNKLLQPKEIGQIIIEFLSNRLHWHHAAIYQYHAENKVLELLAYHQPGLKNEAERLAAEEHYRAKISRQGDGLATWVSQNSQPVYCDDVTKESRYIEIWPEIRSGIHVPLKVGERTIGCLSVESETLKAFNETDKWLITTLATQAANALENTRLLEDIKQSNNELFMAYNATIEGWSRALDLRDKETEGHSQRVTEITLNLARALHVTEDKVVHIRRGALLHDIGKMGVPDGILLKPDPLNDEEWAVMRMHPQYAFDMLSPIAYLHPALDIPYGHHEKWDGSGYPQGLKGETIPMAARIFAVVDVYDALTSDRYYRKAWTKTKALENMMSGSGTHFDPQVLKAFVKILNAK